MSIFLVRAWVSARNHAATRNECGQATAEFATVVILAIALGMAVIALMTGNAFDPLLKGLISRALDVATSFIDR